MAPHCLPELETLYDYDTDESAWGRQSLSDGIAHAVSRVLVSAQAVLRQLDREGVRWADEWGRISAGRWQRLARDLGSDYLTLSELKAIEFDASHGSPLAVCGIKSVEVAIPDFAARNGKTKVRTGGLVACHHRTFADTTHATGGGNYWRVWCPACAQNTGQIGRKTRREIRTGTSRPRSRSRTRPRFGHSCVGATYGKYGRCAVTPLKSVPSSASSTVTAAEAARQLEVSPYTVRRWIRERRVASVKVGGRVRIPEGELDHMVLRTEANR